MRIAVVGGGVLGRLAALTLLRRGHEVTLFDEGGGASRVAAGMLSPWCERETSESEIAEMGARALEMWSGLLASLPEPVYFQREGSFVVGDGPELARLERRAGTEAEPRDTHDVEPEIDRRFSHGLFFPREGQIDAAQALHALGSALRNEGANVHERCAAKPELRDFDRIVDCRGLAARDELPELRGVRGEILEVHAPEVTLRRPVRLLHPRYPLYLVPRPGKRFLVGATQIESDDTRPVTVRSALELLSAAFAVHSGFGEAAILAMRVGVRPAFPNNLPRVSRRGRTIFANGMFRHGFLLSPVIAERIGEEVA